jgi:hypothetical protein
LCTVTIWNDDQEVEMSSLTRHLVRPTAVTLSILGARSASSPIDRTEISAPG